MLQGSRSRMPHWIVNQTKDTDMKIKHIMDAIEEFAPKSLSAGFDNPGLLVGDPDGEVSKALLCVDVTEAVMDEAAAIGADMVISHHPIIFHPLRHITGTTYIERVVARAVCEGIALYAAHTNLDAAPLGMSHRLGKIIGLRNMQVLEAGADRPDGAGYGIWGEVDETDTLDFLRDVQKSLSVGAIRYSTLTQPKVSRVAICTGAGASMAADAKRVGAQVYISADFKYNDFLDAGRDLVIADVGHFESEYCAIELIGEIIRKKIPNFALCASRQSVNPVNYLTER